MMSYKWIKFYTACSILIILTGCSKQAGSQSLKGSYLGQKPPGETPEVFAPGIISTDASEGCCCFSKDGRLFLFVRENSELNGIMIMEQKNGVWTKPRLASFSAGNLDWDFILAPDDKTVFVSSGRPLKQGGSPEKNYSIFVSEKTNSGWSDPLPLPPPVNTGEHDSYPSVSEKGTLYFFSKRGGGLGQGDIYLSGRQQGKYPQIENPGSPINTEHHEVDPYISPDESYLIICTDKPGGYGRHDIYISFRKKDGSWTEPVNMGDKINSSFSEYIPYVTPDGKYFFFTSNKSGDRDIYWMDAKIIENLKPEEL